MIGMLRKVIGVIGGAVLLCFTASGAEVHQAYTFPLRLYGNSRPLDERISLEVLQGIVNRKGPRLFYTQTWTPYNQQWTNVYTQYYDFKFTPVEDSIPKLVSMFRTELNGAVLYDPGVDGSRYVAAMVGGLDNLLPVAKGSAWLEETGLPVVQDFSGTFSNSLSAYEWALEHVMPRCDRTLAHAPASGKVDGKYIGWGFLGIDYVISKHGFVFNLGCIDKDMPAFGRTIEGTPEQKKLYERILDGLEKPALVFGYGEPELEYFDLIGKHGHTYLHWGNNLSFHAAVQPHDATFRQKLHITPDDVSVDSNRYYVAFLSSEGDSMKGPLPFFFGSWFDPARGSVPMNWCINPEMVRFPAMLEYYYSTATTNDYFLAMQVFNFEMKNLNGVSLRIKDLMQQADLRCVVTDFAHPAKNPAGKEEFLNIVQPLGAVDALYEHSTQQGYNRILPSGIPLAGTSMKLSYWHRLLPGGWGSPWQKMYKDPEQRELIFKTVLNQIRKEADAHEPPYLIAVYTDLHEFDRHCEMHQEIARRLDPERFRVVRLDEAMSVLRKAEGDKE
ncbi:MAG: GxGYxYP domain-containing protein [Kiritimatiellales bacterium]